MADVSTKELRTKIKDILKGADLASLSAKKVRLKLQEKIGADLSDRKKKIDKITMGLIMEMEEALKKEIDKITMGLIMEMEEEKKKSDEGEEEENNKQSGSENSEEEEESPPKKKHKPKENDDDGADKPKKKKKKKKKEFEAVGDDDLDDYDEEEKTLKLNDEELAMRLQAYEERGRFTRGRTAKKSPAPKKEKKERKKSDGNSPYSRPCLLSPELAEIMGKDKMARNEVVKRMWEIVKERKLEDPKDRRYMLCDEQLIKVFGKKRVQTFGMMKELKHHIKDEKDVTLSREKLLDTDIYDDEADDDD